MNPPSGGSNTISSLRLVGMVILGAVCFHLSFLRPSLAFLIVGYLGCLFELTRAASGRLAFRAGMALGFLVFVPKLTFFYTLFQFSAVALWAILAFWHGLFVCLGRLTRQGRTAKWSFLLIPALWTGVEYFRSELYYLKFSWLSAGYAFSLSPPAIVSALGLYGVSFLLMFMAGLLALLGGGKRLVAWVGMVLVTALISRLPIESRNASAKFVEVAGLQMEFPVELEVPSKLDTLIRKHPSAQLVVLSEYTFDGPIPPVVKKWCKKNGRYLVVGAKEVSKDQFYNTAYVIDPNGDIVFQQAKAVPIQFFKDGLAAPQQKVWNSPWGRIGICICYDLSYSRVVDELIRQGAQALIVPTMDVVDWGLPQHVLHYRVAPMRAAEYGVPIFRLASSGISQFVNANGVVLAEASCPGVDESLYARLPLAERGALPFDRTLAPGCIVVSALFILFSLWHGFRASKARDLRG